MNSTDAEYFRLLRLVLEKGRVKNNRTGVQTIGTFGAQARFDLNEGFPLLTTKKVFMKAITHELLWFIKGDTNIKYLVDNDVRIWNEWAYAKYLKTPLESLQDGDVDYTQSKYHTKTLGLFDYLKQEDFIKSIKEDSDFAKKWGELGEGTYGGMWREFPYFAGQPHEAEYTAQGSVDQLSKVVDKLKTNPDDRRLIVSAWHPYWVDHCALPPCHVLFQFHTEELTAVERFELATKHPQQNPYEIRPAIWDDEYVHKDADRLGIPKRRLNCQLYQRSCDLFLGVPFNIASYSLLTAMIAQVSNMVPGEFIHTYGDLHIYTNHLEQVQEQLSREPRALPKLVLNPEVKDLFKFTYDDIKIEGYDPHPAIKGEVAV